MNHEDSTTGIDSIAPIDRRVYLKATGALMGASSVASQASGAASSEPTTDIGEPRGTVDDVATPTDLRVEYAENPLGVDVEQPRFSWDLVSEQRNQTQSAYRILVASSRDALTSNVSDVWDSGKVESSRSMNIEYDGPSLDLAQRYHWKVRVWDTDGDASDWSSPAYWETGLFGEENWSAKWIGRTGEDSRSDDRPGVDWTDYSFEADVTLLEAGAGLVFRAQDTSNLYMWQGKYRPIVRALATSPRSRERQLVYPRLSELTGHDG
jgi:hypothetical protein